MEKLAWCALLLLLSNWIYGQTVFRCVGTDQSVYFQAKPCPRGSVERLMHFQPPPTPVAGERASELSDARQNARRGGNRRARGAARTPAQARTTVQADVPVKGRGKRARRQRLRPSLAHPGCPATYEDSGSYVIGKTWADTPSGVRITAKTGLRAAWGDYKSLPTRTYLKNAGLWPDHCPQ